MSPTARPASPASSRRLPRRWRWWLFANLALLVLSGILFAWCTRDRIVGRVVDSFGRPVAGAELTIDGTSFRARTSRDGRFNLDFRPGRFWIRVTHPGILTTTWYAVTSGNARYAIGTWTVLRRPTSPGLSVAGVSEYVSVPAQLLGAARRDVPGGACVDATAPEHLPTVHASRFLAVLPAPATRHAAVWSIQPGGALTTNLALGPSCPRASVTHAVPVTLERHVVDGHIHYRGRLPEGSYCVARYDDTFRLDADAHCFHWVP